MSDWKNILYCGDNLKVLSTIENESIDLIYIDPPFFSNRNYEIIWGDEAEIRSFDDRWDGGINVYVDWMKQRVFELYRVLKPTGSFYLHCDHHASHYLKVMCDEIFGVNNFQNEIIWHYIMGASAKSRFGRKHDTIFFYTKTNTYVFNLDEIRIPYNPETIARAGRGLPRYKVDPITLEKSGKNPGDVWIDIMPLQGNNIEKFGYPTQKTESLLDRIIKASSNENDIVLDAFCGCGTALAVSEKLKRRWIGIDISPSAIALIKKRLSLISGQISSYDVIGMPQKVEDLKDFKPYEFQYWVINEMHGMPSPRKSGDMGIDGFSFLEHCPIQVKQSEKIGRNVVDNFETALRRYYKEPTKTIKGYIVAFSFGRGAKEEVARVKKENIEIHLITVEDILNRNFSIGIKFNDEQTAMEI